MSLPPYELALPCASGSPFVFTSPHSGRHYPPSFLEKTRLDAHAIRQSEDFRVDDLFAATVQCGAPLLKAVYPRAYVDLNREPFELDPKLFAERLPAYANQRSLRVAGGLGTIPRVVADGEEIYAGPIPLAEGLARIERIYRPYHDALRRLLVEAHARFGLAILIDCHSMPSLPKGAGGAQARPDIVLGDRFGTSCMAELTERAAAGLRRLGYTVARNKPYAGGFITEHYGRPASGLHALQIEVNRTLYMDEATLTLHSGFERLRRNLAAFAAELVALPLAAEQPLPEAAE